MYDTMSIALKLYFLNWLFLIHSINLNTRLVMDRLKGFELGFSIGKSQCVIRVLLHNERAPR